MSSDPIEVLRKSAQELVEAIRAIPEHRLRYLDDDPHPPSALSVLTDSLATAIASLSAPKPPPMNDNAVAVNEMAPVNDKPESAEAVATVIGYGSDSGDVVEWYREDIAPGTKLYTAPPRPEASDRVCPNTLQACECGKFDPCADQQASAAVGVGYAKRLATWLWQQHYREDAPQWEPCDDLMGLLSQIDNMVSGLTRSEALAQQPAAVDEARPFAEWHEDDGPVTWWKLPVDEPAWIGTPLDSDWPGYHTHWTPHPACPRAALAGQQQGGPQE